MMHIFSSIKQAAEADIRAGHQHPRRLGGEGGHGVRPKQHYMERCKEKIDGRAA
jgi:hypothetical protein